MCLGVQHPLVTVLCAQVLLRCSPSVQLGVCSDPKRGFVLSDNFGQSCMHGVFAGCIACSSNASLTN